MRSQIPDSLSYENRKFYLNEELLEDYFRDHPDEKPEVDVLTAALWRGYVAEFEIKNDELSVQKMSYI